MRISRSPWILGILFLGTAWTVAASEDPADSVPPSAPSTATSESAGDPEEGIPGRVPAPITEADYAELTSNSPFTRALNLSDSLILTGIAHIGDDIVATLVDKESKETYVVAGDTNAQGWRMVDVEGDRNDLGKVTAKIAVAGGEVISVRFDENQLKPGESKPAQARGGWGRGDGDRDDGDRRGPSSETREKMSQLSEDQRRKLFEHMGRLREENPNMSRDEMREQFSRALDRMTSQRQR